jgi:sugar lactone lactonase YvrE
MTQDMVELEVVWDARCGTSESPVWDEKTRRVIFGDLPGGSILAYGVDDGARWRWKAPSPLGSLGLCQSGRLIVALATHCEFFDMQSGSFTPFTDEIEDGVLNKLNDGKVGPDGCFWVGSQNLTSPRQETASLYRVTPDGKFERKADGYITSNGLAWTPDGKTMIHSNSTKGLVDAWDFDAATGAISNRRRIATLADEDGRPDGAACDTDGNYWSAGVSAGCLNQFSPTGTLLQKIKISTPRPTMPCFVEDRLYITSIRRGADEATLQQHPTMGGLFRMKAPAKGAAISLFRDG